MFRTNIITHVLKIVCKYFCGGAFRHRTGSRGLFLEAFFESREFSCPPSGVEFYITTNTTLQNKKRAKKCPKQKGWRRGACAPRRRKKRRKVSAGLGQPAVSKPKH